jgi:F-type H+-transporting ATPase subunit epsilon
MTDAGQRSESLRLRVRLPTRVLVDETVTRIIAEAEDGAFCLLPRHIDFAAALVPGILVFVVAGGDSERFVAIDQGVLVKCGDRVSVSTPGGVTGSDLHGLRDLVEQRYLELDEHERKTRAALARLEAGTLRAFRELQENRGG